MPTPSEQKALAFVAIVILLGGAVRVLRAGSPASTPAEQQGLAAQSAAAEDAARGGKQTKGRTRRRSARSSGDTLPHVVGGVSSVPSSFARPDRPFDHTPYGVARGDRPAPVPSPRIDSDRRGLAPTAPLPAPTSGKKSPSGIVDMDRATAAEIEQLPRIGPATAQRIVANRDSLGPFGSLAGLKRVKGIGPASLARLAPLISFGGRGAGDTRPP
jgi:DNA uptake protein ComE-like DNA-binding protein